MYFVAHTVRTLLMGTLAVVMMASDASAQSAFEPNQVTVTPGVGFGIDSDADVSLALFGGVAYPLSDSLVAEGELGHLFDLAPGDSGVDSSLTTLHGALLYLFNTDYLAVPYLAAGFGFARFSHDVAVPPASVHSTEIGINLGGGVIYPVRERLWIRGDVRYFRHIDNVPAVWRLTGGVMFGVGD